MCRGSAPPTGDGADPPKCTHHRMTLHCYECEREREAAPAPTAGTTWLVDPPHGYGHPPARTFNSRAEAKGYADTCPPHTRIVGPAPTAGDAVERGKELAQRLGFQTFCDVGRSERGEGRMIAADRLRAIIDIVGYDTCSYSGRGMYGKECIGIVTDEPVRAVLSGLIRECANVDEAADIVVGHRTDNMGLSTIIYWPRCQWSDQDVTR